MFSHLHVISLNTTFWPLLGVCIVTFFISKGDLSSLGSILQSYIFAADASAPQNLWGHPHMTSDLRMDFDLHRYPLPYPILSLSAL